jgi:hypothetical protein
MPVELPAIFLAPQFFLLLQIPKLFESDRCRILREQITAFSAPQTLDDTRTPQHGKNLV